MLVLSRRRNESIMIGDNIMVKILEVIHGSHGTTVRVGIVGPREVAIWRKEIWEEKQQEKINEQDNPK